MNQYTQVIIYIIALITLVYAFAFVSYLIEKNYDAGAKKKLKSKIHTSKLKMFYVKH